jgi:hypothetical protein
MKLRNTKIFFLIEKNIKIRQEVFKYEDKLKKSFKTPFLIFNNVSDEADANIIRFQAPSLNSFSSLQVTQNKIILETNYDNNFESNLELVQGYLNEKIEILKSVIDNEKLNHIGILSLFDNEMNVEEILPLIKSQTNFSLIDSNIIELKYQYKKKHEDKYLLIVDVTPYTRFMAQFSAQKPIINTSLPLKVDSKGLQIKLDFSNRLPGAVVNQLKIETIDEIIGDFFKLINKNKLNNFIKGSLL